MCRQCGLIVTNYTCNKIAQNNLGTGHIAPGGRFRCVIIEPYLHVVPMYMRVVFWLNQTHHLKWLLDQFSHFCVRSVKKFFYIAWLMQPLQRLFVFFHKPWNMPSHGVHARNRSCKEVNLRAKRQQYFMCIIVPSDSVDFSLKSVVHSQVV